MIRLLITPTTLPPVPLTYPKTLIFANIGPIWMKLSVEVKSGQQISNSELLFWSNPPNHPNHPTPYPSNLPQKTNFANFATG